MWRCKGCRGAGSGKPLPGGLCPGCTYPLLGAYRGATYTIDFRTPYPGIGWTIHPAAGGPASISGGAFYDNVPEHPEGAAAWAEGAARRFIDGGSP